MREDAVARSDDRRLETLIAPRLADGEEIVAVARGWVSRPGPWQPVFGLRVRHVVVATNRRVILCSVNYWTRRPNRATYVVKYGDVVLGVRRGRRSIAIELGRRGEDTLLVELGRTKRSETLLAELREHSAGKGSRQASSS